MPVMMDTRPALSLSLGHHMSHFGALAMTTHANSKWSSSLRESTSSSGTGNTFKKHRSGNSQVELTIPPKVILSQEAAAATKSALHRREPALPQPAVIVGNENVKKEDPGVVVPTNDAGNESDPAWGIFKNRETFLEMHIC